MPSQVFGPIVHKGQVEQAALNTLKQWNSTYLTEMELLTGRGSPLERPRSFSVVQSVVKFEEEQFPAVMVISEGLAAPPRRMAGGVYQATWKLTVVAIVSAIDQVTATDLAGVYGAACRALLVQKPSLGGFANSCVWVDEDYRPIDADKRRWLSAAASEMHVEVPDVLTTDAGPLAADPDPLEDPADHPQDWDTVLTTHSTIDVKGIDE